MLPRYFTSSSTKSSCSLLRRPIQPRLKRPSITTPLSGLSSRVTINSPPLTGSRVINGYMRSSSTAESLPLTAIGDLSFGLLNMFKPTAGRNQPFARHRNNMARPRPMITTINVRALRVHRRVAHLVLHLPTTFFKHFFVNKQICHSFPPDYSSPLVKKAATLLTPFIP